MRLIVYGVISQPNVVRERVPSPGAIVEVSAHAHDDCFERIIAAGGDTTDATGSYRVQLVTEFFEPPLVCIVVRGEPPPGSGLGATGVGDDGKRFGPPGGSPDSVRIDLDFCQGFCR